MALSEAIPGMRPGRTKRNLAVASGYVLLFPLVLTGIIVAIPFVVGYAVGQNRNGLAERLARLPGISSTGGATAGIVAFVYVLLAMGVLGAVLPGGEQTEGSADNSSLAEDSNASASIEGGTTAVSPTATGTSTTSPDQATSTSTDQGQRSDDSDGDSSGPSPDSATPTAIPATGSLTETTPSETTTATPTPTQTPSPTPTGTPRPTESDGERTATVLRVVDGDTLKVRLDNGSEDTIRLLGVDTPEVNAENTPDEWEEVPNSEAGTDCLRNEGHEASDWMKGTVADETIRLEFDENEGQRGYYGRLLAYVYLDGQHINYRLVERGHARVYDSSFEKRSSFEAAESTAQEADRGAWRCQTVASSTPTPTPTASSSGGRGQLSVYRVHEDAADNDHENENDEYIVFKNTGEDSLDLSGWTVTDEADHTYTFPSGFTLEAGATVTLYTGSGQDSENELYWGSDSAIWNNNGDTIYVKTDGGEQVIAYEY